MPAFRNAGGGLQISPMARGLWQPLSKMAVTSWAEFSVRLRDGEVGPGWGGTAGVLARLVGVTNNEHAGAQGRGPIVMHLEARAWWHP